MTTNERRPTRECGNAAAPDDMLDIYVPGRWRCPQCTFELTQATMFVGSGDIGHTREQVMRLAGESCPNDGTPMVRVTWREEAEANRQYAVRLIDDVLAATHTDSLPAAMGMIQRLFAGAYEVVELAVVSINAPECSE